MFKPLLAGKADLDKLTFPMIASPKIDGIRCLMVEHKGGAVSRTMKPIPNRHISSTLNARLDMIAGYDGEIVTYTDGKMDSFNEVQSRVMRADDKPDFKFHVFDYFNTPDVRYVERLKNLQIISGLFPDIEIVPAAAVNSLEDLTAIEADYVDNQGWEGVMLRRPDGPYKFGRSTDKEGFLLKVKRFEDSEAVVVGTIERMHNGNEAKKDAFGRTERSSHKANLTPMNSLGALSVEWNGIRFEIGTGFNEAQRKALWDDRSALIGRQVTFKYQPAGALEAPRFPVFLGFRADLTEV